MAVALLCMPWASLAQFDLYVGSGGVDDGNNCRDPLAPCATLGHALRQNSELGDTLHVAAGVYTESGLVISNHVRLLGEHPQTTILQAAEAPGMATNRLLWIKTGATAEVENVTLRHGRSPDGSYGAGMDGGAGANGGGLLINGTARLRNCLVTGHTTGSGGNADAGFAGGRGGHGGGIYCDGYLELWACSVVSNLTGAGGQGGTAGGEGGDGAGLHVSGAALIERSSVAFNQSGAGGPGDSGGRGGRGALWVGGSLLLLSSTVSGNQTGSGGDGLVAAGGVGGSGGGLFTEPWAALVLEHSTLAANSTRAGGAGTPVGAPGYGGGIFAASGSVSMTHILLASNQVASGGVGVDVAGHLDSGGYNFIEDAGGWTASGDTASMLTGLPARIRPLTLSTNLTFYHPLPFASPAVNAGQPGFAPPPETDQVGTLRVQGGRIDIGAYELPNTVLYLATNGVDAANECREPGWPCLTLAHAVSQSLPEDTVFILPGVHTAAGVSVPHRLLITGGNSTSTVVQAAATPVEATDRILTIEPAVTARLTRLTLQHGHARDGDPDGNDGEHGGAIWNNGVLTVDQCLIQSNWAGRGSDRISPGGSGGSGGYGGAIYNGGYLVMSNSLFRGNRAGPAGDAGEGGGGSNGGHGGALCNDQSLVLDQVYFESNRAGDAGYVVGLLTGEGGTGGALYLNGGSARVDRCTFHLNQSGDGSEPGRGGAVYNAAELWVENCTFAENRAPGEGGVLFNESTVFLRHSSLASNQSGLDGGALYNVGPALNMTHVMIADNSSTNEGPDIRGEVIGLGYVLVGRTNGWSFAAGSDETGNRLEADPRWGVLGGYGGATPTLPLLPGSAGIGAGDPDFVAPPATDQRGQPRVQAGRIDLGAYETPWSADDRDGDFMPDGWESAYGLDPDDPGITNALTGPSGDADGDGIDNLSEFIALTRPDQETDYFRIETLSRSNEVSIGYLGNTGRVYTLSYAHSVTNPVWTTVAGEGDVPGNGLTRTVTEPATNQIFYQLRVRLAE